MFKNLFKNTVENSFVKMKIIHLRAKMTSKNTITEVIITTITKAIGKIKTPKKIIKTVMTALMRVTTVERRLKKSRIISKCISTTLTTAKKQKLL